MIEQAKQMFAACGNLQCVMAEHPIWIDAKKWNTRHLKSAQEAPKPTATAFDWTPFKGPFRYEDESGAVFDSEHKVIADFSYERDHFMISDEQCDRIGSHVARLMNEGSKGDALAKFLIRDSIDTEKRVADYAATVGIPMEPEQGEHATGNPDVIWIAEQMAARIREYKAVCADPAAVWTNMLRGQIAFPEHLKEAADRVKVLEHELETAKAQLAEFKRSDAMLLEMLPNAPTIAEGIEFLKRQNETWRLESEQVEKLRSEAMMLQERLEKLVAKWGERRNGYLGHAPQRPILEDCAQELCQAIGGEK